MPTPKQDAAIHSVYEAYANRVAPLIKELKDVQGFDINPLYNEVRAIMGHLSRCYQGGRGISVSDEIKKATGHLDRLALDTYKIYALYFSDIESEYTRNYKRVDLCGVDRYGFYQKFFEYSTGEKDTLSKPESRKVWIRRLLCRSTQRCTCATTG